MRKFKKMDYFYAIMAYFILFIFIGIMFFPAMEVIAWSISIFLIVYLVLWTAILFKNIIQYTYTELELLKKEFTEKTKGN